MVAASECNKIVIFGPNWVGDSIMATPMVSALKKRLPQSHITLVTKPYLYDIWKHNSNINDIITLDLPSRLRVDRLIIEAGKLRERKFEIAIILPHYLRNALLSFLARIPIRLGYNVRKRGLFLTHPIKYLPGLRNKHMVKNYCQMLTAIDLWLEAEKLVLNIDTASEVAAKDILAEAGITSDHKSIGIAPAARFGPAKRWPVQYYAELILNIHRDYGIRPLVFTGPKDYTTLSELKSLCPNHAVYLDNSYPLLTVASLISKCSLIIGNDSGLLHIAAAVGTKTIVIFGSTSPTWTHPYDNKHIIIKKDFHCSPCFKPSCPDGSLKCLNSISTKEVMEAISSSLNQVIFDTSETPKDIIGNHSIYAEDKHNAHC